MVGCLGIAVKLSEMKVLRFVGGCGKLGVMMGCSGRRWRAGGLGVIRILGSMLCSFGWICDVCQHEKGIMKFLRFWVL